MFLKIGHRGARAYETENTLESFSKAIELGVNAIELDVRQSKDVRLVIIHDDINTEEGAKRIHRQRSRWHRKRQTGHFQENRASHNL